MSRFNSRCNDKTVELSVKCPTDYRIRSMNIASATFSCKSTTQKVEYEEWVVMDARPQEVTKYWYYVWWNCTDSDSGAEVNVDDLKTCTLMPNAGAKTFESKTRALSPVNPNTLKIPLHGTGSMQSLFSYVNQVWQRTNLILTFGPNCNKVNLGAHAVRLGTKYLQVGNKWRLRSDQRHLYIESPTHCSYIFRDDHHVIADRRTSAWEQRPRSMILQSVNTDIPEEYLGWGFTSFRDSCQTSFVLFYDPRSFPPNQDNAWIADTPQNQLPKRYGIKFGSKFIQIGTWRLAEHDGERLSISHENGKVAEVHHKDGTRTNPGGTSDAWTRPVGEAEGVFFGHQFIQIGAFRVGASNWNMLSISHVKTGKVSVIYKGSDGTVLWGPRTDHSTVGRPVCVGHKDSV